MDSSITLSYGSDVTSTIVSNVFIDKYMTDARGSDVKVYLYLLRCLQDPSVTVSIESVAEALDEREKDIRTSIKYWDKLHVLSVHYYRDGRIKSITVRDLDNEPEESDEEPYEDNSNITLLSARKQDARSISSPSTKTGRIYTRRNAEDTLISQQEQAEMPEPPLKSIPEPEFKEKPNYSMKMIQSFKDNYPEFDELIDYVENALGKTLTTKDLQTLSFIFEELSFPTNLIRYLYDYCIEKGKKTSSYIEKVAREWHSKGISTVEEASQDIDEFSNRFAAVKTAFGLNRQLLDAELKYVRKWFFDFGFSDDMIREACDRTVLNTSKTDFRYANKILTEWHSSGFTTLAEVRAADNGLSGQAARSKAVQRNTRKSTSDYSQRTYSDEDYAAIEKQRLGIQ